MAKYQNWQDDYWLLLMQLYLRRPVGVKPIYSRPMVELSLELHIPPQTLHSRMKEIANLETPRIERIWQEYGQNPRRLARAVHLLQQMRGFGSAGGFYEGVDVQETFEADFRPIAADERFMPVMLVLILDLYFRLTPVTMVTETPEVRDLARLIKRSAGEVAEVLDIFQHCDPYLNRRDVLFSPLFPACQDVWHRYGNSDTVKLAAYAEQLKEFFR